MADVSKIKLPNGAEYFIKDATARASIDALTAGGLTYQIVTSLPTASATTLGKIYLLASAAGATGNVYDEYMTIDNGGYRWEKIGSTAMDLDGYAEKGDGVTVSGTFTPAGTNAESAVTFTGGETMYSMDTAGSVTNGTANTPTTPAVIDTTKFSGGTFVAGTLADLQTSVVDETLSLTWTAPTADTFTPAALATGFYTAGTVGTACTPTAVTLPTRGTAKTVVTTTTTAKAAGQTFTGTAGTVNATGTIDT